MKVHGILEILMESEWAGDGMALFIVRARLFESKAKNRGSNTKLQSYSDRSVGRQLTVWIQSQPADCHMVMHMSQETYSSSLMKKSK